MLIADAIINAHRDNIFRYERLLRTQLTGIERSYIRARLAEEESALRARFAQSGSRIERDRGVNALDF